MKPLTIGIIGAGPAGLSAALWAHNLGFSPVIIEQAPQVGGMQNFNFLENDWVLGLQHMNGPAIGEEFFKHIRSKAISLCLNSHLQAVTLKGQQFVLHVDEREPLVCDAVIIATGTRYVGEEIFAPLPGFSSVNSQYVAEGPYAFQDLETCVNRHVAIVGAGDNAFENAQMLLDQGCRVSMICRSSPRAQKRFIDSVSEHALFSLHASDTIDRFFSSSDKLGLCLQSGLELNVDRLHILAGYRANSEVLNRLFAEGVGEQLSCDAQGFLRVDSRLRTNITGVYAAGDISNTIFPSVVSAVASGAMAAKTISQDFIRCRAESL